jgi:hypothetical protein
MFSNDVFLKKSIDVFQKGYFVILHFVFCRRVSRMCNVENMVVWVLLDSIEIPCQWDWLKEIDACIDGLVDKGGGDGRIVWKGGVLWRKREMSGILIFE